MSQDPGERLRGKLLFQPTVVFGGCFFVSSRALLLKEPQIEITDVKMKITYKKKSKQYRGTKTFDKTDNLLFNFARFRL
jgi:hypothetical protein